MTSVQNQGNQQMQPILQPANQPAAQVPVQQFIPPRQPIAQQNYSTIPQQTAPPSYAGVNIQIYNPSVGVPNINPTGNTPISQGLPGMAYPSNYYTQQMVPPQNGIVAQGGNANVYNNIGTPTDGQNNGADNNINAIADKNLTDINKKTTLTETTETKETNKTEDKKKTEKRKIVELSDEYIKNLENYLNSQDKEVRLMGAKEVIARLQEDDSRKDDPALTALVNKMLQDPSQQIRFLALSMLDSRTCTGDDFTVKVLKNMQNSTTGYGQDAAQATNILLKMSGKVVEKEFEIPEKTEKK